MSKDRAQSAIDKIDEILEMISKMEQRLSIIDDNIKLLNNRLQKVPQAIGKPHAGLPEKPTKVDSEHLIKVFGRFKNQSEKPMKDVYVKIYSTKGEIIKSRTSDEKGYWEARIPAGSYCVEFNASHINSKFRPININIEVDDSMNEYEVKGSK